MSNHLHCIHFGPALFLPLLVPVIMLGVKINVCRLWVLFALQTILSNNCIACQQPQQVLQRCHNSQFYQFCQCIYHMKIGLQIKCLLGLVIQYYACQQVHCPRNHTYHFTQ